MGRAAERLHREKSFDLVHARSYLPAAAGLSLKRRHGVPLLFDMRGFWPDERVEGGSWPQSSPLYRAVYRRVKQMEADLFAGADRIVSLTEAGRKVLEEQGVSAPIDIIPCCADFGHFRLPAASDRQAARAALGIAANVPVLVYLGSFGSWYMHAEMLDFFSAFRVSRPEARFLIVTQDPPGPIIAEAAARGVPPEALVIRPATRDQVPELLAAADIGLFFIAPVPSKRASSPTKMGELMATGLPIVTNAGVGDVGEILDATGCGVAIPSFDAAAYADAIAQLGRIDRTPDRIRAAGLARFDAAEGVRRYDRIYRAL
jgi:glycosyltransferase involved in cell wall biosynthesis